MCVLLKILALRTIPLSVTYAIWSGVGIVIVALVGVIVYNNPLDMPAVIGIAMIIAGVAIIQLFFRSIG